MINGVHSILYCDDADAARAFFRDVLEWPHVDDGGGWLIFRQPPSELGIHPTDADVPAGHELFLTCDDVGATIGELRAKGVEFEGDVVDRGWGLYVTMLVPGAGKVGLYQPKHAAVPPG